MIFPRLFTCPTLATANFKIGEYNFYETESLYVKCQYVGTMLPNPCMTFSLTNSRSMHFGDVSEANALDCVE